MSEDSSDVRRSSKVSLSKVANLGAVLLDSNNKEVTILYARTNNYFEREGIATG